MTDQPTRSAEDSLRDRIARAACGATSAGKIFPWQTLIEAQRDAWRAVADAVIGEINLAMPCANTGCRMRQITRRAAEAGDEPTDSGNAT